MKSTNIIYFIALILLPSCNNYDNSQAISDKAVSKEHSSFQKADLTRIAGQWMKDCDEGIGSITILRTLDTALIEVNNNQIQISASVQIADKSILFRLIDPNDLGSGGSRLKWKNFSKDTILAEMKLTDTLNATLVWYGFYDTVQKQRTWTKEPDMLTPYKGDNHVTISKCQSFKFVN